jgi:hypothetical protein
MLDPDETKPWEAYLEEHVKATNGGTLTGVAEAMRKNDPDATALATRIGNLTAFIAHRLRGGEKGDGPVTPAHVARFAKARKRECKSL